MSGKTLRIPVSEAKGQLTELVRRVPLRPLPNANVRRAAIATAQAAASSKRTVGATAARSQDFLYDENGMPK